MLTVARAAAILGVDPSRVRQLIIAGTLKATKLSARVVLIDQRDLDAYRQSPPKRFGRRRKGMIEAKQN